MNKFEIFQGKNKSYFFRYLSEDGRIILKSEKYNNKTSAQKAIRSIKRNSTDFASIQRRDARDGKYYFVLKAKNGKIIGTSNLYSSQTGREGGIYAVKRNARKAKIVENIN